MCGRYVLYLRPSQVRQRLARQNMPADEAPDDDATQVRQSYNFAPGYHGLIYRADTSDRGAFRGGDDSTQPQPNAHNSDGQANEGDRDEDGEPSPKKAKRSHDADGSCVVDGHDVSTETHYKLQAAKWGLIPFWTKRPPDYASQMRTINCRDDSLAESRGMWNTMKQRKRCIVVAEGFYEWLKKNDGKEKIPHYIKRKDGQLMCFAGLWDMVQFEGSEEKLYTYTIITTHSNKQLAFLHDRMPVILEAGSKEMKAWLDPKRAGWDRELQGTLKPFEGELECYAVDKAVGKVGNNSPQFVVPVASKENKRNIANFFGRQKEMAQDVPAPKLDVGVLSETATTKGHDGDDGATGEAEAGDSNAPVTPPQTEPDAANRPEEKRPVEVGVKREAPDATEGVDVITAASHAHAPKPKTSPSPAKGSPAKKMRSATSNKGAVAKTPTKGKSGAGNARITSFFGK